MTLASLAIEMLTVALPILLGLVVARLGLISERFQQEASTLINNVTLPCSILASMFDSPDLPAPEMLTIIGAMFVLHFVGFLVAFVLVKIIRPSADLAGAYAFIVSFGNTGFIGFPVITAILGEEALIYASISLISVNLLEFTVGAMMFTGTSGGWKQTANAFVDCFKSPSVIASVALLVCMLAGWTDWGFVGDAIDTVGGMTTPCALLVTGAAISRYDAKAMVTNWRAYVAAAGRLLIAPLAGLAVLKLLGVDSYLTLVLVLQYAMPVATQGTLYALQFDKGAKPMTQGTFISIVASILTIPIVVMACGL